MQVMGTWSEDRLQRFLFEHPEVLPVDRIEAFFGPLVPLAREVGLPSGRLDLLYLNQSGLLTLVECKLWKNEQARRSVIGQILEYAGDMSRMSYSDLQAMVGRARGEPGFDLAKHMGDRSEDVEDVDEARFIDDVSRQLRMGRFLLLIVGDGIRERTEDVARYLQAHAHLNFTFSLVQLGLYEVPDGGVLVQPHVLLQTVEVERAVVRLEGERLVAASVLADARSSPSTNRPARPRKVSQQVFLEMLAEVDPSAAQRLGSVLDQVTELGLDIEPGRNSVKLKLDPDGLNINLGIFNASGWYENRGIADRAQFGEAEIGLGYLEALAVLVGGSVLKTGGRFHWAVRDRRRHRLTISELLEHEGAWLALVDRTIQAVREAEEVG